MIGIAISLWQAVTGTAGGGDTTPGGAVDVLTDDTSTIGLLDDDGTTFLRDD